MSVFWAGAGVALSILQAEPAGQVVAQLPDVVVQGRSSDDIARDFIDGVAAAPRGATVARWNERVCIGVVNLRAETARFLIDRLSSVAADVGLDTEAPGCSPEILIVATRDGNAVARGLIERRGGVLAPGNSVQSRSRRDLERFAADVRPVRWWHISTAVDAVTGQNTVRNRLNENFDSSDMAALLENGPVFQVTPSLIKSNVHHDLLRAIVIIDFDQLGNVTFDRLADYVSFVALAQVDPEGDTRAISTILNLFDEPSAVSGLTDWDLAYLRGLYQSDDTARTRGGREAALRREMLRSREEEGVPAQEN